jgi:hypothetical protein
LRRRVRAATLLAALVLLGAALTATPRADEGDQAVVVFNARLPESRDLAEYYARIRRVPTNQVFGFDLPTSEAISRSDFRESLQQPGSATPCSATACRFES